jgi:hypothetical protein
MFCSSFTLCFWPDSEPTKLLHHPKRMTSKDDIKGLVSLSSFVHDSAYRTGHRGTGAGLVLVQIQFLELPRKRSFFLECYRNNCRPNLALGLCRFLLKWGTSSPRKVHEVCGYRLFLVSQAFCNQSHQKKFSAKDS